MFREIGQLDCLAERRALGHDDGTPLRLLGRSELLVLGELGPTLGESLSSPEGTVERSS